MHRHFLHGSLILKAEVFQPGNQPERFIRDAWLKKKNIQCPLMKNPKVLNSETTRLTNALNRLDFKLSEHDEHVVKNSNLIKSLMKHSLINARRPQLCESKSRGQSQEISCGGWKPGPKEGNVGHHVVCPDSGVLPRGGVLPTLWSLFFSGIY